MKNTNPSKYSNGKLVSDAQYITELICENKARLEKTDLHYKFWNSPKWAGFFRNQIASANKLLKKYNIVPIIRALKTEKGLRIYSLRAPHLNDLISIESKKYEALKGKEVSINRIDKPKIKQKQSKKNILSAIEEKENDN
jgi:hypothetical protein